MYFCREIKFMITSLSQLDLNKTYSYADYVLWQFKERVELLRGKIMTMSPAPNNLHQQVLSELHGHFYIFFKSHPCQVRFAPYDVRLLDSKKSHSDNNIFTVVQPDLCVICDESKIEDRGCLGAPDLIVEILSPGNSDKEMKIKYELYQENGVREYWIIHPTEKQLFIFVLENGIFTGKHPIISSDMARSYIFPDLNFPLGDLFPVSKK